MTIANATATQGSPKSYAVEHGYFQFQGTTVTAEVPTSLRAITQWSFNPLPGANGFVNQEAIYMKEDAIGTANTSGLAAFWGGVDVGTGTSVTVDRIVTNGVGTALANDGTGVTGLWVQYEFRGVNR